MNRSSFSASDGVSANCWAATSGVGTSAMLNAVRAHASARPSKSRKCR